MGSDWYCSEPVFLFTLINLVIDQKARILHDFFEFVMSLTFLLCSPGSLCRAAFEESDDDCRVSTLDATAEHQTQTLNQVI
ncbi:MAG: hypothetical protein ACN6PR_18505 [Achromobacter sp.]